MSADAPRATWFALLAPPAAWFVALNAAYFMVSWACGSATGRIALHAVLLTTLAVSLSAAVSGFRLWRAMGREWPGESPSPRTRTRFLAVIGTLGGALFSVAILWFWVGALLLDPCEPGPRLPFAPSAYLGS